jgi:hypothetical protein
VTITGHNLIPSHFNFTTYSDTIKPELNRVSCLPQNPSTSDMMVFNIETYDNRSGIESVHFFVSDNDYENYKYYSISNEFLENEDTFMFNIDRYSPGEYSYFIVARDYANNTNVFYEPHFTFTISKPLIDIIFSITIIIIIGIVGLTTLLVYKSIRTIKK